MRGIVQVFPTNICNDQCKAEDLFVARHDAAVSGMGGYFSSCFVIMLKDALLMWGRLFLWALSCLFWAISWSTVAIFGEVWTDICHPEFLIFLFSLVPWVRYLWKFEKTVPLQEMPRFGNINANLLQVSGLLHVSAYTVTIKALSVLVNHIPTIIVATVFELLVYNMYISYRYIDLPEEWYYIISCLNHQTHIYSGGTGI